MILPIVAFGDPVLRKVAKDITPDYPNLDTLLENMFETMYNAYGVGLAAPQVGLPIRLFMIDATGFAEDEELDDQDLRDYEDDLNDELDREIGRSLFTISTMVPILVPVFTVALMPLIRKPR